MPTKIDYRLESGCPNLPVSGYLPDRSENVVDSCQRHLFRQDSYMSASDCIPQW